MTFLGFGKKDRVIDLSQGYGKKTEVKKEEPDDSFSFLGNLAASSSVASSDNDDSSDSEAEKKKKLAKRLLDLTNKLDEISTQIYHLQQRVELLERKTGVRGSG